MTQPDTLLIFNDRRLARYICMTLRMARTKKVLMRIKVSSLMHFLTQAERDLL